MKREEQGLCPAQKRSDNQRAEKDGNDHPIRTRVAKDASDRSPRHSLSGDRSVPCHRLIGLPNRTHAHVGAEPNKAARRRTCTSRSAAPPPQAFLVALQLPFAPTAAAAVFRRGAAARAQCVAYSKVIHHWRGHLIKRAVPSINPLYSTGPRV